MTAFNFDSSIGTGGKREMFWHQDGCTPTFWPTAYSTLVEGDNDRCMGKGTCKGVAPVPITTAAPVNVGEGIFFLQIVNNLLFINVDVIVPEGNN